METHVKLPINLFVKLSGCFNHERLLKFEEKCGLALRDIAGPNFYNYEIIDQEKYMLFLLTYSEEIAISKLYEL